MPETNYCPCGSLKDYFLCCELIISSQQNTLTAEQLMRSRYSAYVKTEIDYLIDSTHISQRHLYNKENLRQWSENSDWLKLEIINTVNGNINDITGQVEFKAYYIENDQEIIHHELSEFKKENDKWYFVSGTKPTIKQKIGRNDLCLCGSGKKYKKCCL